MKLGVGQSPKRCGVKKMRHFGVPRAEKNFLASMDGAVDLRAVEAGPIGRNRRCVVNSQQSGVKVANGAARALCDL
jgi:hypothetical protein